LDEAVVSAVIRAKDKASTIRDAITSVKCQTIPVEVIVVDSGSRDATPEIAREMGAQVLSIPADTFTYGSAINAGVAVASAEYVLILSAHCALPGPHWLELALRHFGDGRVVGVNGNSIRRVRLNRALSAEQRLIVGAMDDIVVQDRPFYDGFVGFSNSCALVRRSACNQFPFDEKMTAAEDKEWANRVTQAGHRIVFDAALGTFHKHIRKEGYRSLYRRAYKVSEALTELFGHRAWTLRKTGQRAVFVFSNRSGVMRLAFLHPANLVDYAGRISGAGRAARREHD
jgi:glycosyltransferase involved in cell wall biosynthesis